MVAFSIPCHKLCKYLFTGCICTFSGSVPRFFYAYQKFNVLLPLDESFKSKGFARSRIFRELVVKSTHVYIYGTSELRFVVESHIYRGNFLFFYSGYVVPQHIGVIGIVHMQVHITVAVRHHVFSLSEVEIGRASCRERV